MKNLTNFNYDPKTESIAIVGASQHGKSEHAILLSKILIHGGFNVLILDPNRRFTSLNPNAVIHTLSDIKMEGLQILQPYPFETLEQTHQFFVDLCLQMHRLNNVVFVIDELHNWFKNKWQSINALELFMRNCHNQNSSYIAIFQAPSEVPNYVLRNARHRFCLYLDLPTDIDYMKKFVGKEVNGFVENTVPRFTGFYKQQGEPLLLFKVKKVSWSENTSALIVKNHSLR